MSETVRRNDPAKARALRDRQCAPCEGGVEPLAAAEVAKLIDSLHADWQVVDGGRALQRDVRFPGFNRTLSFVNAVAWIANTEGHHPTMTFAYGQCVVTWTTNAIGGLSVNDFICAAKTDYLLEAV